MVIVAFFGSLGTWRFGATTAVPLWIVVALSATNFILVASLFRVVYVLQKIVRQAKPILPRIITAREDYGDGSGLPMLLLEPNALFGTQTPVSVYHVDPAGFEVLIAVGLVMTVQTNGYIPVRLQRWTESGRPVIERAVQPDPRALAELLVKPSIPVNSQLPSIIAEIEDGESSN